VKVDKQKDDEEAGEIRLRLKRVVVASATAESTEISSCVLVPTDAQVADLGTTSVSAGALKTLQALAKLPDATADSATWRNAVPWKDGKPLAGRTFQNHRTELLDRALVISVDGRDHWYQATAAGSASANGTPFGSHRSATNPSAATATPPMGVAGGAWKALERSDGEIDVRTEIAAMQACSSGDDA
jgi:hypothetical protein